MRPKIERHVEECKVLDIPVELIWTTDEYHEYGGNFTYGWKMTLGKNQYGNLLGHLFSHKQKLEAKKILLESCKLTIEALRRKHAG